MIKKTYIIKGFDCANCAEKSANHLNKDDNIIDARIDFASDRLYISFKDHEYSEIELLDIIREVEDDDITISLIGGNKVTYCITGFDCPSCASKSEAHLNKHERIKEARIDFTNDRLIIEYENKPLSINEIKKIIKEVEDDPIEINELSNKVHKAKILDKHNIWILIRVIIAITIMVLSLTLLKGEKYFYYNLGLYIFGLLLTGYDIFVKVFKHIIHLENPLDEYLLMSLASIGALLVASITRNGDFFDSLMVLTLFQVGQIIEGVATSKSKAAVSDAVSLRIEKAHIIDNGEVREVKVEEVNIDDLVLVNIGEEIPVDGIIVKGEGYLDTSSLTGEFVPVHAKENLEVYAGYLVKEGSITLRATKIYKDSAVSKILELITSGGEKKSKADNFVTKFARWYTPIIFISALVVALVGGLVTKNYSYWVILGLKLMVVACPCAIVISVPLAYFSALGLASKNGIVVKGSNYLDKLVEMNKLVTDKTGTLTKGNFAISKISSNDEKKLLEALYASEYLSNHPIARAICRDVDISEISKYTRDYKEIPAEGVSVYYKDHLVLAGNKKLLARYNLDVPQVEEHGVVIYVYSNSEYLGYVVLSDEIKEESRLMVEELQKNKIDVILLTGDKKENADYFAKELNISKVESELMPADKITHLEKELNHKNVVGYLGDGINDAASIKEADIGFAMGAIGSDAAVNNADVVIMNDNPYKVVESIKIAKIARRVSVFNIAFALFIKIGIELAALITGSLGIGEVIPMWAAVIADTGLTVVLVINALLVLYRKVNKKRV